MNKSAEKFYYLADVFLFLEVLFSGAIRAREKFPIRSSCSQQNRSVTSSREEFSFDVCSIKMFEGLLSI